MAEQQPRKNKMGADDGRSMDHQSLERLRLRAVERIEAGERAVDVARADHLIGTLSDTVIPAGKL